LKMLFRIENRIEKAMQNRELMQSTLHVESRIESRVWNWNRGTIQFYSALSPKESQNLSFYFLKGRKSQGKHL
jgi:hypothetical protein